ncbi:unnamed protein product, partial [Symbiodinium sp. CCMP2456]
MHRRSVVSHSMCRMLRPELVAIILGFGACARPDCREGTCQTLDPYFNCEYDRSGTAGGGNTVAPAHCKYHGNIVVRASFELPQAYANDSQQKFFVREEVLAGLADVFRHVKLNGEERFLLPALWYGLKHDGRFLRRWIPTEELQLEHRWRERSVWSARLVFAVASPAATCELCMSHLSVPLYSESENGFAMLGTVSRFTTHFAIMQRVTPV